MTEKLDIASIDTEAEQKKRWTYSDVAIDSMNGSEYTACEHVGNCDFCTAEYHR